MDEIIAQLNNFQPYMYEPGREVSSTSSSDEDSSNSDSDIKDFTKFTRIGNVKWCECQNCKEERREIDCLCCQEVASLNSKFEKSNIVCIIDSPEFSTLCLNEYVLQIVLTGLHVSIGCLLYTSPSPRDKRQSRMPSSA